MKITEQTKIRETQTKLLKDPRTRRIVITKDQELLVEGETQYFRSHFAIISPLGLFVKINEKTKFSVDVNANIPLGLMTDSKYLINNPDSTYFYVTSKKSCDKDDYFMMLSIGQDFIELIFLSHTTPVPFRLAIRPDQMQRVTSLGIVLANTISTEYAQEIQQLFFEEGLFNGKE